MREFAFKRGDGAREGYQKHHLIPVEVVSQSSLASIILPLKNVGFDPQDFDSNGLWLPSSEDVAIETGLPMHRGPHPHYNEFVSDQVAFLIRNVALSSREGHITLKLRLNHFQSKLHCALSRADTDIWLNRRDPREDLAKYMTFDDDLRQLSMADLLG
jgi:A nuclease family of the HNH/ENDO VII superfamily with conserved AHH